MDTALLVLGLMAFAALGALIALIPNWWTAKKRLRAWEKQCGKLRPDELESRIESLRRELNELGQRVIHEESVADLQSYGLYERAFDFEDSPRFKHELSQSRAEQKQMVRAKTAAVCHTPWTVEGSKRKGQKMVNEQIRLMLRAFNGDCDAAIAKMTHKNANAQIERVYKAFDAVNKLGATKGCEITRGYLDLKIRELRLTREYHEKKEEEREEQRAIREQIREEQRAQQELDREIKRAEQEEAREREALRRAREQVERATGEKAEAMRLKIVELERRLAEAEENTRRAVSRAQLTKSGFVYIISNIGSFGEGVFKIGMTRRLEPNDRVRELGDASVPFQFDVHAMIASDDAPALEAELHRAFDERRVNLVNRRKEFFKADLEEIRRVIDAHPEIDVTWTLLAEAEEYWDSEQMRKSQQREMVTANDNTGSLSG